VKEQVKVRYILQIEVTAAAPKVQMAMGGVPAPFGKKAQWNYISVFGTVSFAKKLVYIGYKMSSAKCVFLCYHLSLFIH
jgi:hypothetical protein